MTIPLMSFNELQLYASKKSVPSEIELGSDSF